MSVAFRKLGRTAIAAVILAASVFAQEPPAVPEEYQDLASFLDERLSSFDSMVRASWDGAKSPVIFGAHLNSANGNLGVKLLQPDILTSVQLELDGLKALGAKGVALDINYPILDPNFTSDQPLYLALYRQVVSEVRARGLKLLIESQVIFSQEGFTALPVGPYYESLTLEQYQAGRAAMARLIAQELQPDYLSVITEPDSEGTQTGKAELATVSGSTGLLNLIISEIQAAGVPGVRVGAGFGTWILDYAAFAESFAATGVNYIGIHIYAVNRDYLPRAIEITDIAQRAGKAVAIGEAWLFKLRESELNILPSRTVYSRDPFAFWTPLDAKFLQAIVNFAHYKQLEFVAPFFGGYFRAQVEYNDSTRNLSPADLENLAYQLQSQSTLAGTFTSLGLAYEDMLANAPDVTPPSPPAVRVTPTSPTSAFVSWDPAADDVGAAGYVVYRDGVQVTVTALMGYPDSGLSDGQTYTYVVLAFDARGNLSIPSVLVAVTTPDVTAPSLPQGLAAQAITTNQVTVTWSASADNVGVVGYRVFRGLSPDALVLVGFVNGTTFNSNTHQASTTYYYAVQALDRGGNSSPISPAVSVTTLSPDSVPPSVPTGLLATAVAPKQVNLGWQKSTDNVAVVGYRIYRGLSATALNLVAGAANASYVDANRVPNTTYFYAVVALDARGNASERSDVVSVKTPR